MPNRAPNPESVSALRHQVSEISEELAGIKQIITEHSERSSIHSWLSRNKFLSTVLAGVLVLLIGWLSAVVGSSTHKLANAYVDDHVRTLIAPTETRVGIIDERTSRIEGKVDVLQAQILAQKYSAVPREELKKHHDELASAKTTLASVPRNVPNFWPTTFQVITLLSQATSNPTVQNEQKEGVIDTVVSNSPRGISPVTNSRVVLKNLVAGITFINSIIRFDPSVRLANDTFINCVFIFPSEANPPANLQQIGSELLAADLSHATIKGS